MPRLTASAKAYRIGSLNDEFPIWSGVGAALYSQRWNDRGQQVVYAAQHYSTAMLEVLARQSRPSEKQRYIEITFPKGLSFEVVTADALKDWREVGSQSARAYGADWIRSKRSAILYVPSVIADMERNVVINSVHAEFSTIRISEEFPMRWDQRLFK